MPDNLGDLRTYRQWQRAGFGVKRGSSAIAFLVDEDRTQGRALFAPEQTQPIAAPDVDEQEGWTTIVTPDEWNAIKAGRREISKGPKVKVRRHEDGAAVWCGPNKEAIGWLKAAGYRYDPTLRYWTHADKDPEYVAKGFEAVPGYRVERDWDQQPRPTI